MGIRKYNLCALLGRCASIGIRQFMQALNSAGNRCTTLDLAVAFLFVIAGARRALPFDHVAKLVESTAQYIGGHQR